MAIFGMGIIVAPIVGPVLGGWITDNWTWPWIFYINVPFGCLAAVLSQKLLFNPPYSHRQKNVKIDSVDTVEHDTHNDYRLVVRVSDKEALRLLMLELERLPFVDRVEREIA